jgi:hypothetical protein
LLVVQQSGDCDRACRETHDPILANDRRIAVSTEAVVAGVIEADLGVEVARLCLDQK